METVSIVIATFGSPSWAAMACERALPSAMEQGCQVIVEHGETLAGARNHAASAASGDWLVFLDADDELQAGYAASVLNGSGDLRVSPLIEEDESGRRVRIPLDQRDIERLNPCHVGTAIRRRMFESLGGFPEFSAWEDWGLFLRAVRRGAIVEHLPADGPAYVAHKGPQGRNGTVADPRGLHAQIRAWA